MVNFKHLDALAKLFQVPPGTEHESNTGYIHHIMLGIGASCMAVSPNRNTIILGILSYASGIALASGHGYQTARQIEVNVSERMKDKEGLEGFLKSTPEPQKTSEALETLAKTKEYSHEAAFRSGARSVVYALVYTAALYALANPDKILSHFQNIYK